MWPTLFSVLYHSISGVPPDPFLLISLLGLSFPMINGTKTYKMKALWGNIVVSPDLASSSTMEPNASTARKMTSGTPMMFENCRVLSPNYRARWTVSANKDSIDFGLEATTGSMNYMAFGWADPKSTYSPMQRGIM